MEELLNDTRLLKRLKKGKISEEEFEKKLTGNQRLKAETVEDMDSEGWQLLWPYFYIKTLLISIKLDFYKMIQGTELI